MRKPPVQKPVRRRRADSVGLRDVAEASGYSTATVSWALRGMACVPEATKRKVRAAAEKLGYRPDPKLTELAAHLQRRRRHRTGSTLALITPTPLDLRNHPTRVCQGVSARANDLGYGVEEFPLDKSRGGYEPRDLNRVLLSRNIQGLIFFSQTVPTILTGFDWPNYSPVALGYTLQQPRLNRVCSHHFQSLLLGCEKLEARGYRRIGLILDASMDLRVNRIWRAAFLLHGDVSGAPSLPPLIEQALTPDRLEQWIRAQRPDCAISMGPRLRDLILRVLRKMKRKIPRDFGHVELHVQPDDLAQAGIDQEDFHQGRALVDLVVGMILSNERGIPSHRKTLLMDGLWRDGNSIRSESPKIHDERKE